MSWRAFFPNDYLALSFVLALIAWFAVWVARLNKERDRLLSALAAIPMFDQCLPPLRLHQQWRDRQRLKALDSNVEPALFFDESCRKSAPAVSESPILIAHLRAIFVAGCEESELNVSELNAQTCAELADKSQSFKYELFILFLAGLLGALLDYSRLLGRTNAYETLNTQRVLAPLIWAALLNLLGVLLLLRHWKDALQPLLSGIRRKTTTAWIPKLYPTVAQRAARWAMQTLQNAARVTDASAIIDKHAIAFVGSVESARKAAEAFSEGMRGFSGGIDVSNRALENAQTRIAQEVQKFGDSLARWGSFEDEIRRFYATAQRQQENLANEHRALQDLLSGYHGFVQRSTETLNKAAGEISAASASLPAAFQSSADQMQQTVSALGEAFRHGYEQHSAELINSIESVLQPVLNLEERMRALGVPFDEASKNMLTIANNIWRLNDSMTTEIRRFMAESKGTDATRNAAAGS